MSHGDAGAPTTPQGRRVIVTGGTKGIGLGIAHAFIDVGDTVALLYGHDSATAREAVRGLGGGAKAYRCDVSHANRLRLAIERIWAEGPCHVLVNNAATITRKPLFDLSLDDWERVIRTNLTSYFVASQTFARLAAQADLRASIVNISSTGQRSALPNQTPYLAAKGGVGMLTKSLALELAGFSIRVNAVAPGTIRTEMNRAVFERDPGFREEREKAIPLGRLGVPSDVGGAVVFLASTAANFITGATLFVDGGSTVW